MYMTFFVVVVHVPQDRNFSKADIHWKYSYLLCKRFCVCWKHLIQKKKSGQSLLPTSSLNKNRKRRMNLIPLVLTQPICIILTHSIILHDMKKTNNWVLQKWCTSQEYVLLRAGGPTCLSPQVRSRPWHTHCHIRCQISGACNCIVDLLKLYHQREGLIIHQISAVILCSNSPYLHWIKCSMNLYSK